MGASKINMSPTLPTSREPWLALLFKDPGKKEIGVSKESFIQLGEVVPAALMVAATRASFIVSRRLTQAKCITKGIDRQCALGLKSLPNATGTLAQ